MHEQLIGYLLRALDDAERSEVERLLASDGEARRALELLRKSIQPLELQQDASAPPPGLAAKTCALLRSLNAGQR